MRYAMSPRPLMTLRCSANAPVDAAFRHLAAALILIVSCHSATVAASPWTEPAPITLGSARVGLDPPSAEVIDLEKWVIASRDNSGMPYLIIDKVNAAAFLFDAAGHFQAGAPVLLGLARGDRSIKGIGDKKMSAIARQDRITPAGRFVASLGYEPHDKEILWVDYNDAIALHPVVKGTPQERRAERLQSLTSSDNRISYGCINVPLKFYDRYVNPAFRHTSGVVYILPETREGRRLFWSGKVEPEHTQATAKPSLMTTSG